MAKTRQSIVLSTVASLASTNTPNGAQALMRAYLGKLLNRQGFIPTLDNRRSIYRNLLDVTVKGMAIKETLTFCGDLGSFLGLPGDWIEADAYHMIALKYGHESLQNRPAIQLGIIEGIEETIRNYQNRDGSTLESIILGLARAEIQAIADSAPVPVLGDKPVRKSRDEATGAGPKAARTPEVEAQGSQATDMAKYTKLVTRIETKPFIKTGQRVAGYKVDKISVRSGHQLDKTINEGVIEESGGDWCAQLDKAKSTVWDSLEGRLVPNTSAKVPPSRFDSVLAGIIYDVTRAEYSVAINSVTRRWTAKKSEAKTGIATFQPSGHWRALHSVSSDGHYKTIDLNGVGGLLIAGTSGAGKTVTTISLALNAIHDFDRRKAGKFWLLNINNDEPTKTPEPLRHHGRCALYTKSADKDSTYQALERMQHILQARSDSRMGKGLEFEPLLVILDEYNGFYGKWSKQEREEISTIISEITNEGRKYNLFLVIACQMVTQKAIGPLTTTLPCKIIHRLAGGKSIEQSIGTKFPEQLAERSGQCILQGVSGAGEEEVFVMPYASPDNNKQLANLITKMESVTR